MAKKWLITREVRNCRIGRATLSHQNFQHWGCCFFNLSLTTSDLIYKHIRSDYMTGILTKQKFISDCRYRVIESSSLVSVLFREVFSHPYISFFHLLVNGFCVTSFRTFLANCYELSIVGTSPLHYTSYL